jgi:D-amino-acid dehydrogenase
VLDVIIVGGGIVGSTAAYRCVQHGARTLLIDSAHRGQATNAGAGIVSLDTVVRDGGPNRVLADAARDFFPRLLTDLAADGAPSTEYARCGEIIVASNSSEAEQLGSLLNSLLDERLPGTPPAKEALYEITPGQARERFPPLGEVTRALWSRDAARMDGRMLTRAIRVAAQARGLEFRTETVDRFDVRRGRLHGVWVGNTNIATGCVVLAGGAWSHQLGQLLGIEVNVRPQRGQIAHLRLSGAMSHEWPVITSMSHHYLVPWPNGHVAVGATQEDDAGWDVRVTADGARTILEQELSVAPGLADATLLGVRVGLRPLADRGYPYLGALEAVERAYIATGHGAFGLSYGPWSGYAVADLALGIGTPDLSSFALP